MTCGRRCVPRARSIFRPIPLSPPPPVNWRICRRKKCWCWPKGKTMQPNLDELKTEIPPYLESRGFVVFHGVSRIREDGGVVYWDAVRRPEYKEFLDCAAKLGIKLLVMHVREFEKENLSDVQSELEDSMLPHSERRDLERRLKALTPYEGFTATIELSFDFEEKVYMFEVRSEFMNELLNIMGEVDSSYYPTEEPEDDS